MPDRKAMLFGGLAVLFYAVHGVFMVNNNEAAGLLWCCHVANLLVAAGWLLRRPLPNAIGFLWLAWGNMMWALYLAGGGEFSPTSVLTHIGGFVLAIAGLRAFGLPRRSWAWAVGGMAALVVLARATTPYKDNVNLAHHVHDGWESLFPNHFVYMLLLLGGAGLVFYAVQRLGARLILRGAEYR